MKEGRDIAAAVWGVLGLGRAQGTGRLNVGGFCASWGVSDCESLLLFGFVVRIHLQQPPGARTGGAKVETGKWGNTNRDRAYSEQ